MCRDTRAKAWYESCCRAVEDVGQSAADRINISSASSEEAFMKALSRAVVLIISSWILRMPDGNGRTP